MIKAKRRKGARTMSDRKVFHDSVIPLPQQPGLTTHGLLIAAAEPQHGEETMDVHFALAPSPAAEQQLEARVARGEVVPPDELASLYTAHPADADALEAWLQAEGFTITQATPDGIYARATVNQISHSLEVTMSRVTKDGVTYNAAANAPSLPTTVAASVRSINGLQPFRQANKHLRRIVPHDGNRVRSDGPEPAPNIANAPPYLLSEILGAYNAHELDVTGTGQTIAILIDTFPTDADLTAFWTRNGVPATLAHIEKVNVAGGALPAPSGEETLDASWASGIAPGAQVRIYATGSLSFVAIDRALDRIIADVSTHPGMRQVSISLGLGETFLSPGEVTTEHAKFLRLAAAGVNVFVSSGDAGSNPGPSGHSANGPLQAEYESSDSAVIGVGGTALRLNPAGAVTAETGWSGSGGGASRFFARPTWQQGPGVPPGTQRLVPDVCAAADPNTGAFLVFNNQPTQIGGTSWSAPVWAGLCALMNEARQKAGKAALSFLNPLLYPLLATPAFRDVMSGSNGAFHCNPGYDQVTGVGAPNIKELLARIP
jgi:kumamolisin